MQRFIINYHKLTARFALLSCTYSLTTPVWAASVSAESSFDSLAWVLAALCLLGLFFSGCWYLRRKQRCLARDYNLLKDTENEWSHALDYLDEPIYMVDLQDRIIRANRAFYQKIKASPEQAIGLPVTHFTHPEGEEKPCKVCMARRLQQDTVITLEADDPVNKAGSPMQISIHVVRDGQGKATSIIQKMTDLTAQRQAERLIRENEDLFKGILNATPDPLVATNQHGLITLVNDQFVEQFGYSREEIIGQKVEILVPQALKSKHAEERKTFSQSPRAHRMAARRELVGIHKDGHEIPVEISLNPFYLGSSSLVIATLHDISERKEFEQKLKHLASFPELNPMPIIEFEDPNIITYMNPAALEIFADVDHNKHKDDVFLDFDEIVPLIKEKGDLVRDIDLGDATYEQKITYSEDTGLFRMYVWDITKIRNMTRQMAYQASHDALTGLINRREFEQRLEKSIQSSLYEKKQHVLCYIDLDQFKVVNDTCGHIAGDELLKQLSNLLQTRIRESDSLARLGGDEFGILFAGCNLEKAASLAEEIRATVDNYRFLWDQKTFKVGASIGLVAIDQSSTSITEVMSAADSACYLAKEHGRNRIHVFKTDDVAQNKQSDDMNWVHRLQSALEENRFTLYCQKIAALNSSEDDYYEILLRLKDNQNKLILPFAFLPAAERYGLIREIDRWVINETLSIFHQPGFRYQKVSINLSGHTLSDDATMQYIIQCINKYGIDPSRICFEVTETAMIANLNQANRFITNLKELGCKIALDDFGSGLSSFAYLKNLPVDFIKIDGGFIRGMCEDSVNAAMVEAIIHIGKKMQLPVIAEFVENQQILDQLTSMGADFAQGYHIEKPKPVSELITNYAFGKVTPV